MALAAVWFSSARMEASEAGGLFLAQVSAPLHIRRHRYPRCRVRSGRHHLPFDSQIEDVAQNDDDAGHAARRVIFTAHFVRYWENELWSDFIEEVTT